MRDLIIRRDTKYRIMLSGISALREHKYPLFARDMILLLFFVSISVCGDYNVRSK